MKKIGILFFLLLVVVGGWACLGEKSGSGGEKILRLNETDLGYPSVYTVAARGRSYLLISYLFDTLTWKDDNGVVPLLAENWEVSDDQRVWVFHLVKNAAFSDGMPVTAEDVRFSYEYLKAHPHPWVALNMLEAVRVIDTYTVQIVLKQAYAPFITDVAGNVPIIPKHIWQDVAEPEKFSEPQAAIGSGPFRLIKYDNAAGTYIFAANKSYFAGPPVIDKLVFAASSNAREALAAGEIDGAQFLKYDEAMKLAKQGRFRVIEGPGLWVCRIYFNFAIPEFTDQLVRQAMYYAINRQHIVDKVMKNSTIAGNPGHIHPASEWYYSGVKQYDYDAGAANRLLENGGFPLRGAVRECAGRQMEYEFLVTEDMVNVAEMIQNQLALVGIKLNIKAMDQKSVDALIYEGKFQLALNGHGSFGGDPVLLARFVGNKAAIGSTPAVTAQGGAAWSNVRFDELFAAQLQEPDKAERYRQVAQLQQILAEELPTLTLFYQKITFAYNQNVFDGWFFTKDGVAIAIPSVLNKLVFLRGTWNKKS